MNEEKPRTDVISHKSFNYEEAELWDIEQQIRMTPEERQAIARELRIRVYGSNPPDVRESHRNNS